MKLAVAPQETQRQTTRRTYIGLAAATAVGVTCALFIPEQLELPQGIACDKVTITPQLLGNFNIGVDWSSINGGEPDKVHMVYPGSKNGILAAIDNRPFISSGTIYTIKPEFGPGDTAANSITVSLQDTIGHTALCKNISVATK